MNAQWARSTAKTTKATVRQFVDVITPVDHLLVVCRDKDSCVGGSEEFEYFSCFLCAETARWFVRDDDGWIGDGATHHGNALAFPAREFSESGRVIAIDAKGRQVVAHRAMPRTSQSNHVACVTTDVYKRQDEDVGT